jgi:membrane-associated protease RseP (regulator of RpoE activity)
MAFSLYFLISNLLRFVQVGEVSYVAPVVPGLTLSLYWLPYFAFAVVVVILPHEFAHGIVSRLENIPVLSTGILAALVFFGAFVEPDEKEFEKASLLARLRMLASGSSTNLVTALLFLILLTGLFAPSNGILIHETVPGGPLDQAGIGRWDVIQAINGTSVVSYSNFSTFMARVKPGEIVNVTVLHDNMVEHQSIAAVAAPENQSRAIIGFSRWSDYHPTRFALEQYTGVNLYWTVSWTYLIAFSVAVFNMLPLYPFDGERVLYYPLERLVKKRKRELRFALTGFTLGLFALNIILSLWRYGLLAI